MDRERKWLKMLRLWDEYMAKNPLKVKSRVRKGTLIVLACLGVRVDCTRRYHVTYLYRQASLTACVASCGLCCAGT